MNKTDISIQIVEEPDQKAWDKVVNHPLQSWSWGEFRKSMGIDVVRLGVFENMKSKGRLRPELVEGWQITFHKLPYLPLTIGYFPKGPNITQVMLEALENLGRKKNAIFIQLEPNTFVNLQPTTYNLQPSHHPLFSKYTFVLDLTKSQDELFKAMHSKTRYNIRVAQKHEVTIKEDASPEAFSNYLALSHETTNRQGFYAHSDIYQQKMWETLSNAGIAHLFTATYQKKILAAWILLCWNDTVYYPYGATSRNNRETMAPNLMLWQTALWAKEKGYKKYDLWGALGPKTDGGPNINNSWYGFHRFKEGYAPTHVEFIGSFDFVINPILYKIYCIADTLRWIYLSVKKRS